MRWIGLINTAALTAMLASHAIAQTVVNTGLPASTDPKADQLQDVIVQARRVDEVQQRVPVAVTTLDSSTLREQTVVSLDQLQSFVPNFEISPSALGGQAAPAFTIRGLTGALLTDPAVVAYFDDVVQDPRNFAYSTYDLNSVQVLKGPQGTLFGKNSTGGAILFQPTRPGPNFGGWIDARYGAFNDRDISGAVNLPVNDTLQFRIAGELERRDGTIKSIPDGFSYDNRNHQSLRIEMLWRPSAAFDNYLQGDVYKVREISPQPLITGVAPCPSGFNIFNPPIQCLFLPTTPTNPLGTTTLHTIDIGQQLTEQQAAGLGRTVDNYRAPFDIDFAGVTDIAQGHVGPVTFKNIAHYDQAKYDLGIDIDGTAAPIIDEQDIEHNHFWSEEFQFLGSVLHDQVKWLGGGYVSELQQNEFETAHQVDIPGLNPANPVFINDRLPYRSTAVFGQATYDASDWLKGLSVTGGYRYTWDRKAFTDQRLEGRPIATICGLGGADATTGAFTYLPGVDPANCTRGLSAHYADDNYDASLNWQATSRLMVYLTARRGYKAGGFNFTASEPAFTSYAPETLDDVEVGLKSDWRIAGAPVRLNAALFHSSYDNIQAQVTRVDPISHNLESLIINDDPATGAANRATLEGGEVELTVIPLPGLTVSGFYGYTSGRYERFTDSSNPAAPVDLAGQPVSGIANVTDGVTATYSLPAPPAWGQPLFTASYYGRSKLSTNTLDTEPNLPGYQNLDLRLEWRAVVGRPVDVALYGSNVTNQRYITNGFDLLQQVGFSSGQYNEPATYGIELRYHFGEN